MDGFLNFLVSKNKHDILCAHFSSNEDTIRILKPAPDSYYKCYWPEDDVETLHVLGILDEGLREEIEVSILKKYKTRKVLVDTLLSKVIKSQVNYSGNLDIDFCPNIKVLPQNLRINGYLSACYCYSLSSLPKNLGKVRGLYINWCTSLKSLPKNLKVMGNVLAYRCTSLTSLPENLSVMGDLDLRGCTSLKSLPKNLKVGGDLSLNGCKALKSIPKNLEKNVKGKIYR